MKVIFLFLVIFTICYGCNTKKETPVPISGNVLSPAEIQIKMALLAAPPEKRDSSTVYGFNDEKQLVLLKQGSNELICLADNPADSAFSVSCYYKDLEPFMKRGRELKEQGMNDQQVFDTREKEVMAGTLLMPKQPATLFAYSAKAEDVNRTTGEVKNGYLRYVIYIPYATSQSTGLPLKPSTQGMPWIMDPGTHRAHIMINP